MRCPFCNYNQSKVVDSRPTDEDISIRRRRECEKCGKRFTTYEKVEEQPMLVVKKEGSREVFSRQKLLNGLIKAFEKRPVSIETIENVAAEIEKELYNTLEKEVPSQLIGELVMTKLKKIDDVAYVRFASVYRQFKDLNTFIEELNKLILEK